jgi:hypothetical protein
LPLYPETPSSRPGHYWLSSEVASLLEELHVCPLPREGEPTVLREAEEVLPLVVDEIWVALLVERRLELVKGWGLLAPTFLVTFEPTHSPTTYFGHERRCEDLCSPKYLILIENMLGLSDE